VVVDQGEAVGRLHAGDQPAEAIAEEDPVRIDWQVALDLLVDQGVQPLGQQHHPDHPQELAPVARPERFLHGHHP
jgi:hypothetical protein